MNTGRLEAFTDGVIAIIITIMVLELKVPSGGELAALSAELPVLLAYVLSFINVGLYWNNHHHLMHATDRIDGRVLWANLFLLFWLSLVPFVIRWHDESHFAVGATAAYGVVLGMAAVGYELTVRAIITCNGPDSRVARAIGRDRKGLGSVALYAVAVPLAFVSRPLAIAIYVGVIAMWLVPDRRIARTFANEDGSNA
jgi:uncharacterized membrane protein